MPRHNGIPDRWLDYNAVGKRLDGTRFVAFKVPLNQSLNSQLSPSEVFGPWELLDAIRRDHQELGLIIDLTFTTRYYRPQDLPASLLCVKIFTGGHVVPNDDTILAFKRAVRRFLRDNADNDKLIGVHCTHGLNRTGYMICRYLIDVDGMDPAEAVELFNSSRGHAIERQNYINDLHSGRKRSNKGMSQCPLEFIKGTVGTRPRERQDKRRCDQPPHGIPEEERPTYGCFQPGRPPRESPQHGWHPRGARQHYPPARGRHPHGTFSLPRVALPPYGRGSAHPADEWVRPQYAQARGQVQRPRRPSRHYTPGWANQQSGDRWGGAGPGW
uniref:RNA/RNP complex-1-interacting phosphatase n=1 Tax=Doryrhamphus excisus TaxID=161450 RepID=UPI0025AE3B30|nr:RNA/RNP complex-1-interacting phosphatase [Doryrhamphus excisus]